MWKQLSIGLVAAIAIVWSNPVRAADFESLLQSIMTPQEAEIYQKIGKERSVQLARQACQAMDSGVSLTAFITQVSQSLVREGLSQEELQIRALYTGKVIAAGVVSYCPQHTSKLMQLQI